MQIKPWILIAGLTLMAPLLAACDNDAPKKEEAPASSDAATPPADGAAPPAETAPAAPAEESEGE